LCLVSRPNLICDGCNPSSEEQPHSNLASKDLGARISWFAIGGKLNANHDGKRTSMATLSMLWWRSTVRYAMHCSVRCVARAYTASPAGGAAYGRLRAHRPGQLGRRRGQRRPAAPRAAGVESTVARPAAVKLAPAVSNSRGRESWNSGDRPEPILAFKG